MQDKDSVNTGGKLPRGEASALQRRERQALALRENLARRKAQARQRKTDGDAAERGAAADIARS